MTHEPTPPPDAMPAEPAPPANGTLRLHVPIAPVSHQAAGPRRAAVRAAVRAAIREGGFVLTDDVKMSIEWRINPEERYESDASADVDNIAKPILDALCGPGGVLIDDCQVQELTTHWADRGSGPQSIRLQIVFDPDAWLTHEEIVFIRVAPALALPVSATLLRANGARAAELIASFAERFALRDRLNAMTGGRQGMMVLPIQRVYHVSRIRGFPLIGADDVAPYLARLITTRPAAGAADE